MHSPSAELNRQGNERFSRGDYTPSLCMLCASARSAIGSAGIGAPWWRLWEIWEIFAPSADDVIRRTLIIKKYWNSKKSLATSEGSERHWPISAIFAPMRASGIGQARILPGSAGFNDANGG